MHIYQDAYTRKEKSLAHLFSHPFMETKHNRPTLSKKSWKGNSVDDSGTDKYPYQTEDKSRLNHIPEFYIPDVLQNMLLIYEKAKISDFTNFQ